MEILIKNFAGAIGLVLEATAIVVIALGGFQAIIRLGINLVQHVVKGKIQVWQEFAVWLILGLEFMLAADIVRTVISPTWNQVGQLAAIALIRTFLNYFLQKDIIKSS